MSAELSVHRVGGDRLQSCFDELHACQRDSERFFSGVFEELDALCARLVRRREESDLEAAVATAQNAREVQQLLEAAQQDRDALRSAQEAAQLQADRLAAVAAEFSGARSELVDARNEFARRQEELQAVSPQADNDLQERLAAMERQRAVLEQERAVLEAELEGVRHRAAEMTETLDEQKRQLAQQQDQCAEELKRLRRLLEAILDRVARPESERPVQPAPAAECAASGAAVTPAAAARRAATGGDPVLDSVMAQFEMLQKDIARRRAGRAESG